MIINLKDKQKRKKYLTSVLSLVVFLSSVPQKVFAASCSLDPLRPLQRFISGGENLKLDNLPCMVSNAVQILLIFAGVYAVVRIVLAGIQYSAAIGNPEQQTAAKKALIWSVIGFVVAMCAYAIMSFIVGI